MFYVYILKSENDHRHYYGFTSDLRRRLRDHNSGKVVATRRRKPFVIQYYETYDNMIDARKRELFFKKRSGYKWLKENKIL